MTLTLEKIYQIGETVPVWAEVKDWDDAYVTPTSAKVTIYNESGEELVTDATMTEDATGKFVYYYNTEVGVDSAGWHPYVATIVDGTGGGAKTTISRGGFRLE